MTFVAMATITQHMTTLILASGGFFDNTPMRAKNGAQVLTWCMQKDPSIVRLGGLSTLAAWST